MATAEPKTTVWILGAGFSKPLGGPLLADMLSWESRDDIRVRFANHDALHSDLADNVRSIYTHGHKSPPRRFETLAMERRWEHAEEFLDYLDSAAEGQSNGPAAQQINRISSEVCGREPPVVDLRNIARRLIAAECCAFLQNVATDTEKWQPYHRWSTSLDGNHSIITFNYDTVLERLENPINIVLSAAPELKEADKRFPVAYKLHGCVSWRRLEPGKFEATGCHDFALSCQNDELAIATPGPHKMRHCKELRFIWKQALDALENANAVVFVGYRFPPTDAEARMQLLEVLRGNKRRHIDAHIVLGPRTNDPDPRRLHGLVAAALARGGPKGSRDHVGPGITRPPEISTFTIQTHPLFAEDFFTVMPNLHTGAMG